MATLTSEQMAELARQISGMMQTQADNNLKILSEKVGEIENRLAGKGNGETSKENKETNDESDEEEEKYEPDFSGLEMMQRMMNMEKTGEVNMGDERRIVEPEIDLKTFPFPIQIQRDALVSQTCFFPECKISDLLLSHNL